ncbi:MAG: hypothetical protein AAF667_11510 [Pseudomonadota bacterium]
MSGGLIWYLLFTALVVYPLIKIMPRHGLSPMWALLAVLPVGVVILLWIIAFKDQGQGT